MLLIGVMCRFESAERARYSLCFGQSPSLGKVAALEEMLTGDLWPYEPSCSLLRVLVQARACLKSRNSHGQCQSHPPPRAQLQ